MRVSLSALQVKACEQYVAELLEGEGKHLLFAHHRVLLDALEALLRRCVSTQTAEGLCRCSVEGLGFSFPRSAHHLVLWNALEAPPQVH